MPHNALHTLLQQKDPLIAAKLKPGDTQRLLRALEVIEATGISLDHWQKQTSAPLFPQATFTTHCIDIPRDALYARIDRRFETMMENGALYEVKTLMDQHLPPDTPILRAHGVPELSAFLRGEMNKADAIARAQQNTRNYAKRQMTWIRNQLTGAQLIASSLIAI